MSYPAVWIGGGSMTNGQQRVGPTAEEARVSELIFPRDQAAPVFLSAQEYEGLSDDERGAIGKVMSAKGKDKAEYMRRMKELWPRKFVPQRLTWRHRG